ELVVVQRLLERHRLHDVGVLLRAVVEGVDVLGLPLLVRPHLQLEPLLATVTVAELDHRLELPGRIDVQQGEGEPAGVERLLRQAQHDGGVLADRVEHHRPLELGGDLADDVDALGLEQFQMGQVVTAADHPHSCLASLLSILSSQIWYTRALFDWLRLSSSARVSCSRNLCSRAWTSCQTSSNTSTAAVRLTSLRAERGARLRSSMALMIWASVIDSGARASW